MSEQQPTMPVWPPSQQPAYPPPSPPSRPPGRNTRLFVTLGVLAALVVGGVIAAIVVTTSGGGARRIQVTGSLAIADPEGAFPGTGLGAEGSLAPGGNTSGPCFTLSGYTDIGAGADVVISDDAGKTLTLVKLSGGRYNTDGACVFPFAAKVPAGKRYYGVTVTHRGTVKFTEAEVAHAALTLGS